MNDQAKRLRHHIDATGHQAKTIAIISGKGGVGKSNTALNFCIELQKSGKKVLLFDLDIGMGNIDILLGKDTTQSIVDLFNDYSPIHDMIESGPKGLSYIAGGTSLNDLVYVDESKLNFFFEQYESLVDDYDYIFFDMGAGATESSLAFILSSDECIVVTTPEPTAITDAYSMIKQVIRRKPDMPLSVIMNRCDRERDGRNAMGRFKQVVEKFLPTSIVPLGILPNDKTVNMAVIRQTPYVILDKNAAISKAIRQLVSTYLQTDTNKDEQSEVSFVQKLKRFLTVRNG